MPETFTQKLEREIVDRLTRSPFFQRVLSRVLLNHGVVEGKVYPYAVDKDVWWVEVPAASGIGSTPESLPIPPRELWEGYGNTVEEYLQTGREHTSGMLRLLDEAGFRWEDTRSVLDFGCSAGRMLRWLAPHMAGRDFWGVDIASAPIHWAAVNLAPMRFAMNSTLPPLPFEAGSFDLIYCGSVFSHIADLADLWLLELKRLLRPGGLLYLTIHDRHTIEYLRTKHAASGVTRSLMDADERTGCLNRNFLKLVLTHSPKNTLVFYEMEHLRKHWGRHMEFVSVTEEGYGFQTALILRRPGTAEKAPAAIVV